MKKNYLISFCVVLISIVSTFSEVVNGQIAIKWEENPGLAKKITDEVPEGKALLVFEGKEDFNFDSSVENIIQPQKDGLIYKLLIDIEPSSRGIIIRHSGSDDSWINFGTNFSNTPSLPALKNKETKYFKLSIIKSKTLIKYEITKEKKKGGLSEFQAKYDKEAMVILYVEPVDLDLIIEGSDITESIHEAGRYKIYIKPDAQKIILRSKGYDDTPIDFDDKLSKENVRYFHVEIPRSYQDVETYDPNIKVGDYLISSNPAGALIQMYGNPDFNSAQHKTPFTIQGYKTGTEIISLKLNDYESEQDTIVIGSKSKRNKLQKELIPTFAYINCNIEPGIPISKVLMDGKELSSIETDKNYKCPKGTHNIEITAPHYYSEARQISLIAGKINEINIILKPKMGTLTLYSENADANNAKVFIDNREIGNIPLNKYILIEGEHSLRIEKAKFASFTKSINIKVNDESKSEISLFSTIKAMIKSDPTGATIYIDGEQLGTSNLTTELTLGTHSIRLVKEYFEPKTENIIIHENDQSGNFTFSLVPLKYPLYISSKPTNADVYVDGNAMGQTTASLSTTKGIHNIKIKRDHYFPRSFITNVSASGTSSVNKVLYPKRLLNLSALYGLDSWGVSAGGTISYFSLSVDIFPSIKNNIYTTDISHETSAFNFNPEYMVTTGQKISVIDSSGFGWAVKAGFVLLKPFMMRIHGGYGTRSFDYYDVYKVTQDATYSGNGGSGTIYKDELIKGNENKKDYYKSFIIGIEIPIRYLNFRADYWLDSERGKGFVFGLGFNIF